MIFGHEWVKILIVPSFRLKFDDITVMLSLILFSPYFGERILILYSVRQKLSRDYLIKPTVLNSFSKEREENCRCAA